MLFQIEEPDGSPLDAGEGPGAYVGIDLAGTAARVAIAVGGNAEMLTPRDQTPDEPIHRGAPAEVLTMLRGIAERALGRPVTHAVLVVPALGDGARQRLLADAAALGLTVTRLLDRDAAASLAPGAPPNLAALYGAAVAAEDDAFAAQPRGLQP